MTNRPEFSIYTDEELMQLIHEKQVAAFDALYARYSRRLMNYFTRMLNDDRALAKDALQDVFLKIVEKPSFFDTGRPFKTWVFSVASNICKNHYRHVEVKRRHDLEISDTSDHSYATAGANIDGHSFRMVLDDALREISPEKRDVFLLRYQEDKSLAEISDILGIPVGSVKSRLHYTLRFLEEKLKAFKPV